MRIWHQSLVDMSRAPRYEESLRRRAELVASPGKTVSIHGVRAGTYGTHKVEEAARHVYLQHLLETQILDNVRRAEAEGYDAFAIVTLQDPGLRQARSLVDMPVVGYGESAMHLACMLGERFGIVAFNRPLFPVWRVQVESYGLERRSVPITLLDRDYAELLRAFDEPEPMVEAFGVAARSAIASGADVIIPGQALLGAFLTEFGITRVDEVPVIDPLTVSISFAEMLVRLRETCGISVSRRDFFFARPAADLVEVMRGVLDS